MQVQHTSTEDGDVAEESRLQPSPLLPPVDTLENGLMALIAPTNDSSTAPLEGSRRKLQGSVVAAVVAWVEVIAFLGETFFAMILSIVCRTCVAAVFKVVASSTTSSTTTTTSVWESLWDATFVCLYVLRRSASNFHQPSLRAWIHRLGLWPPSLSWLAIAWTAYQVVGFLAVLGYQFHTKTSILTWSNYYSSATNATNSPPVFQAAHILEILLLSPIKEELVFRGVAFHVLVNRLPNHPKAAALCVSVLFGCTHLINLKHAKFSVLYVVVQACLGVEIGFFFGLHYIRTQSLVQVIGLHVVNNVLSSFTSTQMDLIASPVLQLLLLHSVVLYGALIWHTINQLDARVLVAASRRND